MRRFTCLVLAAMLLAGCHGNVKETPSDARAEQMARAEAAARQRAAAEEEGGRRAAAEQARRQAEAARQQGTAPPPPPPPPVGAPAPGSASVPEKDYVTIDVFYGTNRKPAADFARREPADRFGGVVGDRISYGQARVSIPKSHVPGMLESPRWYLLEFKEDPRRHVVLEDVWRMQAAPFFESLAARVRKSQGSNAFVFVHGYNVGFDDAARRTAQLAHDLRFDGAAVFYSWPSQAALSGYFDDERAIARSVPLIERFLADLADRSRAKNLYVIGHSMGTRGVTQALRNLVSRRPDLRGRFRGIILAAPDIDAKVFREQLAPAMRQASGRVTLYASSEDLALKASRQVNRAPRAGDTSEAVVLVKGIDTVDVSGVDKSVLAHSYFMESDKVMADIREMLRTNRPAAQRKPLQTMKLKSGVFWKLLPP